jgi:DNA-binding CsgD family transcriptional regulator
VSTSLFDRAEELTALADAVEGVAEGRGSVTLIEAPPGFGKTSLCDLAALGASRHRVEVLAARGTELQEQVPFGLARVLLRISPGELGDSPDRGLAAIEQLAFACFERVIGEAGEEGVPHLLIVDDAQWADRLSAAFLSHLIPRAEELPIAFLLASRPERGAGHGLVDELARSPTTRLLRPGALDQESTAAVVREECGEEVAAPLIDACFESSGGSPLLVRELARELAAAGPSADVATVRDAAPATVLRADISRLAHLGAAPAALAEAVAILDGSGSLEAAAELAGLDPDAAEDAADTLAGAGLLAATEPLDFAQPLVGAALRAEMGPFARARAHRRAAAVLDAAGAPVETVAAQLLHTRPAGEAETVARLRDAAALALARGDATTATRLLERALDEPPTETDLACLLVDLAEAEALAGSPRSTEHGATALGLIEDPAQRARASVSLARALHHGGEFVRVAEVTEGARAALPADDPRAVELEALWIGAAMLEPTLREKVAAHVEPLAAAAMAGEPLRSPALSALLATSLSTQNAPVELVERLALEAFAADPAVDDDSQGTALGYAAFALLSIDAFDPLADLLAAAVAATEKRGAVIARSVALNNQAMRAVETGELEEAVRTAEASIEIYRFGWTSSPWSTTSLILAHVFRGDLEAAREALALGETAGTARPEHVLLLESRATLRLAEGDAEAALVDAREATRIGAEVYRVTGARVYQGVRIATEAAVAAGRFEEARELAAEAVALGEAAGTARAIGNAHLAAGLLDDGEESFAHLEAAVAALVDSPARFSRARALFELGAGRARRGDAAAAEEPLREAVELADEFGAAPLVAGARRELAAIGRRPRRAARTGVDALTPSERRVADLAAQGLSTPQIAHRLFITRKTVESHLGQAYRKLGVAGRAELAPILREPALKDQGASP